MRGFLKIVLGSFVGFILASIIGAIFFTATIAALISSIGERPKPDVKNNSVLVINLNYPVNDRTEEGPSQSDMLNLKFDSNLGLNDILRVIEKGVTDDRIKGILLRMELGGPGFGTTEEIRDALSRFRESGKFVISYGETVSQRMYYLGTIADEIYINPHGIMEFRGLSSQIMFFKNMLDRLGVEMQVFYDGRFKSASEPFRLTEMSEENRLQVKEYLNSLYGIFQQNIANHRNVSTSLLDSIANNLLITDPLQAYEFGLIDGVKYEDEVRDILREKMGLEPGSDKLNQISMQRYARALDSRDRRGDRIAVVYAEGTIVDGKGSDRNIGSKTFAETFKELRENDRVKAIVLRINSPGGSALASEVIYREIILTKNVKPIIVSMGNLAASGGYYIAAPADMIIAQPNTITGSIGVFGMLPNMQELFNDKFGITFDTVKTHQHSDFVNVFRPLSETEKEVIQEMIHRIYDDFIERVAFGRDMSKEEVDEIAQGRVWSGNQALEIGLVDSIGFLHDAIRIAAQKAGIETYTIDEFPKREGFLERILSAMDPTMKEHYLEHKLGEYYRIFKDLEEMTTGHPIQMRMPFYMDVK